MNTPPRLSKLVIYQAACIHISLDEDWKGGGERGEHVGPLPFSIGYTSLSCQKYTRRSETRNGYSLRIVEETNEIVANEKCQKCTEDDLEGEHCMQ